MTDTRLTQRQEASPELDDEQRLDAAWVWLCASRKTAPDNADIWDLRYRWPQYRTQFLAKLQSGTYQLRPMQVVGRHRRVMWSAEDALALKWVALGLEGKLPLHARCEHVKGHGSGSSVKRLAKTLTAQGYTFICRTDIKGYYQHIDKTRLLSQLHQHITRPDYLNLLTQYVHYSVEEGGEFHTPTQGIARGCALSPLMGALHLWVVDHYFAGQSRCHYIRYMDDFVILSKTRWQLRKHVKKLNQFFAEFGFRQHPDKTFIGRVTRGFDWLGAWLTEKGVVGIAPRALANHREKLRQLYEQTRLWTNSRKVYRVLNYKMRWILWSTISLLPIPVTATVYPVQTGKTNKLFSVSINAGAQVTVSLTRVSPWQYRLYGGLVSVNANGVTSLWSAANGYTGYTWAGCPGCVLYAVGGMSAYPTFYDSASGALLSSQPVTWSVGASGIIPGSNAMMTNSGGTDAPYPVMSSSLQVGGQTQTQAAADIYKKYTIARTDGKDGSYPPRGSIDVYVYVPAGIPSGTIYIPNLQMSNSPGSCNGGGGASFPQASCAWVNRDNQISITTPPPCTVSLPTSTYIIPPGGSGVVNVNTSNCAPFVYKILPYGTAKQTTSGLEAFNTNGAVVRLTSNPCSNVNGGLYTGGVNASSAEGISLLTYGCATSSAPPGNYKTQFVVNVTQK